MILSGNMPGNTALESLELLKITDPDAPIEWNEGIMDSTADIKDQRLILGSVNLFFSD